jgi:hypothetical protein
MILFHLRLQQVRQWNLSRLCLLLMIGCICCPEAVRAPVSSRPQAQAAPEAAVEGVRDLGPLQSLSVIRGRDGGYSARFGGLSVWVFADTPLNAPSEDGSRWRSSTRGWTGNFDARNGVALRDSVDRKGAPGEFLPFTPDELAYNAAHNREELGEARSRWGLWPGPLVVEPKTGKAIVFYSKVMCGNGPWAFESVGQSIALWDDLDHQPVRLEVRLGADEPTLLFPKGDAPPAAGAVAVGDSIYAYDCRKEGMAFSCIVGRAKFSEALKRASWRFFAGNGRWSDDWNAAVAVMNAAPMLSVHWNKHIGRFLAVYSAPLVNTIEIRTAERPEGPWSAGRVVVTGIAPKTKGTWDYCGMAHAELARDDGRVEYFTYCRETGFLASEIRLVEVTFK